jgi:hypothetical protein
MLDGWRSDLLRGSACLVTEDLEDALDTWLAEGAEAHAVAEALHQFGFFGRHNPGSLCRGSHRTAVYRFAAAVLMFPSSEATVTTTHRGSRPFRVSDEGFGD